jgi:hypothetical protein
LLLSLKSFVKKRGMGYARVIYKKIEKKLRNNGQVSEILKTMGT